MPTPKQIAKPYLEGWANDKRDSGTRNGPVHLFGKPFERPLCRRAVRSWNFEGETETDFCRKCLRIATEQHDTRNAGYDPEN